MAKIFAKNFFQKSGFIQVFGDPAGSSTFSPGFWRSGEKIWLRKKPNHNTGYLRGKNPTTIREISEENFKFLENLKFLENIFCKKFFKKIFSRNHPENFHKIFPTRFGGTFPRKRHVFGGIAARKFLQNFSGISLRNLKK